MEALLEREGDVDSWNDGRLDELSRTMKDGFAKVDREMKEGFAQVGNRMDRLEDRIERLTNTFMVVGGGFAAAVVAATIFG
jgi:hypothetical protein